MSHSQTWKRDLVPRLSLHQPRGTIMAKWSVQPNLFSFFLSKISEIHTNKEKRSRVDENEEPDDSRSESEPEFGAEAPPGSASPRLH